MTLQIPLDRLPLMLDALMAHDVLGGSLPAMAGWIEQESAWHRNAIRYEPAFFERYVKDLSVSDTEKIARSTSWGLLQIMGQVAREHGFQGHFLTDLLEPATNLDLACRILKKRYNETGSWFGALAAYNGGLGGNRKPPYRNAHYASSVLRRAEKYGYVPGTLGEPT
jgi:soluble lytic murein transglycosylase-like protein